MDLNGRKQESINVNATAGIIMFYGRRQENINVNATGRILLVMKRNSLESSLFPCSNQGI